MIERLDEDILKCIHLAIAPCYLMLTFCAVLTELMPSLHEIALHGKTRLEFVNSSYRSNRWLVEKRYFRHFYIMGLLSFHFVIFLHYIIYKRYSMDAFENASNNLALILLWVHLWRRYYECLTVHEWRDGSKMHLAGYLLGMVYYLILPFVFITLPNGQVSKGNSQLNYYSGIFGMICIWSQLQQFRHHSMLAIQRAHSSGKMLYILPHGCWFEYVSCPHYLAEILVYLSIVLIVRNRSGIVSGPLSDMLVWESPITELVKIFKVVEQFKPESLLVWIIVNLCISARSSHRWYLKRFKDYPQNRSAIIPFLF